MLQQIDYHLVQAFADRTPQISENIQHLAAQYGLLVRDYASEQEVLDAIEAIEQYAQFH